MRYRKQLSIVEEQLGEEPNIKSIKPINPVLEKERMSDSQFLTFLREKSLVQLTLAKTRTRRGDSREIAKVCEKSINYLEGRKDLWRQYLPERRIKGF